jgi:hypothetical protein
VQYRRSWVPELLARWIGSPASGAALHRSDIAAFVIGAVNSRENPGSVEVYLIPRVP